MLSSTGLTGWSIEVTITGLLETVLTSTAGYSISGIAGTGSATVSYVSTRQARFTHFGQLIRSGMFGEVAKSRSDGIIFLEEYAMNKRVLCSWMAVVAAGLILATRTLSLARPTAGKDIVGTADAAGSFKTLAAALQAADLAETLKGTGPFTVFAPTDEAFAKLPAGTVEDLLKPENKEKLRAILLYHVVPGNVTSKGVVKLHSAKTVGGESLTIAVKDGKVMIDNAVVIKADIESSNGVIYVIDTVLLPK
jgi:uncharacterized surface protein with fasciclin (FAS1) repeats